MARLDLMSAAQSQGMVRLGEKKLKVCRVFWHGTSVEHQVASLGSLHTCGSNLCAARGQPETRVDNWLSMYTRHGCEYMLANMGIKGSVHRDSCRLIIIFITPPCVAAASARIGGIDGANLPIYTCDVFSCTCALTRHCWTLMQHTCCQCLRASLLQLFMLLLATTLSWGEQSASQVFSVSCAASCDPQPQTPPVF